MIVIAPTCRIHSIRPELVLGLVIVSQLYWVNGDVLTLFHVIDGGHSKGSLHYIGAAADFSLPNVNRALMPERARKALGPDFDYVQEADHSHLEFQPKDRY